MSQMSRDLNTVGTGVYCLLQSYPELRDNDTLLLFAYLNKFCGLKKALGDDAYNKLKEICLDNATPKFESIRRVRQKIQESGLFLGKKRQQKLEEAELVKEVLGYGANFGG